MGKKGEGMRTRKVRYHKGEQEFASIRWTPFVRRGSFSNGKKGFTQGVISGKKNKKEPKDLSPLLGKGGYSSPKGTKGGKFITKVRSTHGDKIGTSL